MKPAILVACVAALLGIATGASAYHYRYHGYYPYPYSWYVSPFVVSPYYVAPPIVYGPPRVFYGPPPVVVERRYVEVAPPQPATPQYRQGERSYAQAEPQVRSESRATIATPTRLERYTLSATELFEFDKATLRMPQPKLDEIADTLVRNPQIDHVTITGYTDRIGSDAYNLKLSQRRADAVKAYLVKKGVASARLAAIGKGKANPVVHCDNADRAKLIQCLEPNRRVEVESITVEVRDKR